MNNPRYTEEISIREGRQFLKATFGPSATIPHGSRVIWMAGVRYITDQPGVYLVAGSTGLEGIQILPPAVSEAKAS